MWYVEEEGGEFNEGGMWRRREGGLMKGVCGGGGGFNEGGMWRRREGGLMNVVCGGGGRGV